MTNEYEFSGTHYIANYSECKEGTLTNITKLKEVMTEAVNSSGATILQMVDHIFISDDNKENPGYTSMYLLSESHATIHTYPEVKSCFLDIFTCGKICTYKKFDEHLRNYLEPQIVTFKVIKRDTGLETLKRQFIKAG